MHCSQCVRQETLDPKELGAKEVVMITPGFYHLSVKMISRSQGRSAVAAAAYRAGVTLHDERYGTTHDYAPRRGIAMTNILAPEGAPRWALDREQLWNRVEATEKRIDAQLAREIELGLPDGLTLEQKAELVEAFAHEELLPRGMVVDYAIHAPGREGDARNWHAHVLCTLRPLDGEVFGKKDREACSKEALEQWRETWASLQNERFDRYGMTGTDGRAVRVDHRSYERQGLEIEPTVHVGVHAMAMERSGRATEVGDMNRAIAVRNAVRLDLLSRAEEIIREEARLLAERESERKRIEEMMKTHPPTNDNERGPGL